MAPSTDDLTESSASKGTTDTTKATSHNVLSFADEVQCLVGETSEKFVPQPSKDEVISDTINGLRRFKDAVRWKEYHRIRKQEERKKLGIDTQQEDQQSDDETNGDGDLGLVYRDRAHIDPVDVIALHQQRIGRH